MLFGASIIDWVIRIFVAVCVFILLKWLIPLLFVLVGFLIPDQIATVVALLVAVLLVWGWHTHGTVIVTRS